MPCPSTTHARENGRRAREAFGCKRNDARDTMCCIQQKSGHCRHLLGSKCILNPMVWHWEFGFADYRRRPLRRATHSVANDVRSCNIHILCVSAQWRRWQRPGPTVSHCTSTVRRKHHSSLSACTSVPLMLYSQRSHRRRYEELKLT